MKNRAFTSVLAALLASAWLPQLQAQSPAITYQGFLTQSGEPVTGPVEIQTTLWNAASGGAFVAAASPESAVVNVSNGLFTVQLDFGATAFNGQPRFIQLEVRTTLGPFTALTPRHPVTATPYALRALQVGSDGIYTSAVNFNNAANAFTGAFSGDGSGLNNVNATTLGGIAASNVWKLTGNAGANPAAGSFLGTTDNLPLELRVNGQRALRVEPGSNGAPNLVGGSMVNQVSPGVVGATVSGGGTTNYSGLRFTNGVSSDYSAIGGGVGNRIGSNAFAGTIAGGDQNRIGASSPASVISGGRFNQLSNSGYASIGGGYQNIIGAQCTSTVIGGGEENVIGSNSSRSAINSGFRNNLGTNSDNSVIGGGTENNIGPNSGSATIGGGIIGNIGPGSGGATISGGAANVISGPFGTIPGGNENLATNYAFAAGNRAKATNTGAFVWGDSFNGDVVSTNNNSVTFRASGGYRLFSSSDTVAPAPGASLAPGASSWGTISDRGSKKNVSPVDDLAVLETLTQVPVQRWNYKWESTSDTPHLGPMAQEFKAAFYPGRDDKSITTLEFDGVALAAIQGLNHKVEARSRESGARIQKLETENAELKQTVAELKRLMEALLKNGGEE